jgi:hypothetical protein
MSSANEEVDDCGQTLIAKEEVSRKEEVDYKASSRN